MRECVLFWGEGLWLGMHGVCAMWLAGLLLEAAWVCVHIMPCSVSCWDTFTARRG